jgi:ABC-2 type transport system ATP-binding protein
MEAALAGRGEPNDVVEVAGLRKAYGRIVAVNEVSFEVHRGEILGMVGPNGAGKTTTIECVQGLRRPDAGSVRVLGLDPFRKSRDLRCRVGSQLQDCQLQSRIRVGEALDLFAAFQPRAGDWRALLERVGCGDQARSYFGTLSGGQKQRVNVALALVGNPELVFFDELTTGLDPQARRSMWALVREIRAAGTTVFLTTHFMEEAERLCDRVAVMDGGRILAVASPRDLIRKFAGGDRLTLRIDGHLDEHGLAGVPGVTHAKVEEDLVVIWGRAPEIMAALVARLDAQGCRVREIRTEQPTLEDAFLSLTGYAMRD